MRHVGAIRSARRLLHCLLAGLLLTANVAAGEKEAGKGRRCKDGWYLVVRRESGGKEPWYALIPATGGMFGRYKELLDQRVNSVAAAKEQLDTLARGERVYLDGPAAGRLPGDVAREFIAHGERRGLQMLEDCPGVERPVWEHYGARGHCAFSPDGKHVVAVEKHCAIVLDAASGQAATPRLAHEDRVDHAAFSPDGKQVATASTDGTACVWDVATGKRVRRLPHGDTVNTVAFSPDGKHLLTAGGNKCAAVWEVATGEPLLTLKHKGEVHSGAFSSDGRKILTTGFGGSDHRSGAFVWDARTGEPLAGALGFRETYYAALSPDGEWVATGGNERVAYVWDADTGRLLAKTTRPHWGRITSVTFSPDGKRVATSTDGYARVWDAATGEPVTKPLGDRASWVRLAAFSPDGTRLLAAGEGGLAAVWDIASGKQLAEANGQDAYSSAAFHPDGTRFVTAGVKIEGPGPDDPAVGLWRVPAAKQ